MGKSTVAWTYAKYLGKIGLFRRTVIQVTARKLMNTKSHYVIDELAGEAAGGRGGISFHNRTCSLLCLHSNNPRPCWSAKPRQLVKAPEILDYILALTKSYIGKLFSSSLVTKRIWKHSSAMNAVFPVACRTLFNFRLYRRGTASDFDIPDPLWYRQRMKAEGGLHGLYVRAFIRSVTHQRGTVGYGNVRTLQNEFANVSHLRVFKRSARMEWNQMIGSSHVRIF
ncbi:hypothetical protein K469DRAFT_689576 [Zopfia rhizophila CBS 207.26]|uniref:Uncharacterized protein n=1 Tax=Zopfia rhizophila CBS 207.26 TaxID=1314779 RepID=A0A6A6DYG2_9PEZI|nr:hypothetical protein K469DRAFT_689576 [Zopfia rhizophila CBS 207.26]